MPGLICRVLNGSSKAGWSSSTAMFSFRVEREDPRPEPAGDPSKKRRNLFRLRLFLSKWCRRRDLNPHGRRPPPPQDGVSTKFHHFGTDMRIQVFRQGTRITGRPERCSSLAFRQGRRLGLYRLRLCSRLVHRVNGLNGLFRLRDCLFLLAYGRRRRGFHDGFVRLWRRQESQSQGSEHEDNGHGRGHFAEERSRSSAPEKGLTRAAESGTQIRALPLCSRMTRIIDIQTSTWMILIIVTCNVHVSFSRNSLSPENPGGSGSLLPPANRRCPPGT